MTASLQGILVTILVLGVLIAIHESGHFLAAKSLKIPVRQFAIGFGPRIFGFQWGETECRLNVLPLGGYCAFADDMETEEEGDTPGAAPTAAESAVAAAGTGDYMRDRPIWQRTWVVSAGVIFNFVSAWLMLFGGNLMIGMPTGQQSVSVKAVLADSPAAKVGLKPGDRLISIGGTTFKDYPDFREALGKFKAKPTTVTFDRAGTPTTVNVTPTDKGLLGFQPNIMPIRRPVSGLGEAITSANDQQVKFTVMLTGALYQLFTSPASMLHLTGGPVAIVAMGDQVYQNDPWLLLEFAVILSIELAIINLFPLPALDGGHLILLALEKIRGRPLPRAIEERILVTGFMLIMGLGVMLILKDIMTVPGMYGPPKVTAPTPAATSSP